MKTFVYKDVEYKQIARTMDAVVGIQLLDDCCANGLILFDNGSKSDLKGARDWVVNELARLLADSATNAAIKYEGDLLSLKELKISDTLTWPPMKPTQVPGTQSTYNTLVITDAGIISYSHNTMANAKAGAPKQPRIRVAKNDINAAWPSTLVGPDSNWQTIEKTHTATTAHMFEDTRALISHGLVNLWKLSKVFE